MEIAVFLRQSLFTHYGSKEIVGHEWPSQLSFLNVLFMCGYAFPESTISS